PLDLTLLHSPPVADGWNSFLGAVRTQTIVPADLRELAISRVAVVNRLAAMDWLKGQAGDLAEPSVAAEGTDLFGEGQWAALLLADEMTRNVQVSDETFAKVKGLFGACYNCVSRFLVALDGTCQGGFLLSGATC
ncbi:hypothetical protein EV126DRAFT_434086, partial [Verticillium dahliae]